VARDTQEGINADELEQALAEQRSRLAALASGRQRGRRVQALEHMASYVAMLRDAAAVTSSSDSAGSGGSSPAFSFKVEFEDGRWSVAEKELATAPRIGDVISFPEAGSWRVRATQLVRTRPAGKAAREFFVCVPSL
jgi:hypothetical protein